MKALVVAEPSGHAAEVVEATLSRGNVRDQGFISHPADGNVSKRSEASYEVVAMVEAKQNDQNSPWLTTEQGEGDVMPQRDTTVLAAEHWPDKKRREPELRGLTSDDENAVEGPGWPRTSPGRVSP